LLGGRTTAPTITAHLESLGSDWRTQKIVANLSNMLPGETVSIESTFSIAEENADKVRLDDWIYCGVHRVLDNPNQENAPWINVNWNGGNNITHAAISQLEKVVGGTPFLVVKYEETWINLSPGAGAIDGTITRGY